MVYLHSNMKTKVQILEKVRRSVEEIGLFVGNEQNCFTVMNKDLVLPYVIITLCTGGSLRGLYDMKEMQQGKNDLCIIMPGHIVRQFGYSDDYTCAWLTISPKILDDILAMLPAKGDSRFDQAPMCHLTDEQAERLLTIIGQLEYISGFTEDELPHRYLMLKSQLTVGYELLIHYREKQDREWMNNYHATLYSRFCDMVVEHHTHSRNVNFYAERLGYEARYFSKLFRVISNGVSPMEWIGQYVTTRAKRIMVAHPKQTVKEIAFELGFPSTANFCRYFKRVTGITPKEYREGEVWNEEE
ncbi:MAG: helix-turn-helix domain-containing protein [Bacteroidales bacterium]|nr:helix-turn-helix domain-containing protein [Bacteroidales bacterium]